jgi:predicted transport protein
MELQKNKILLFLKIDPSSVDAMPSNAMDMRKTGHWGTGNFALTVQNDEQAEAAKPWIRKAFENVGG